MKHSWNMSLFAFFILTYQLLCICDVPVSIATHSIMRSNMHQLLVNKKNDPIPVPWAPSLLLRTRTILSRHFFLRKKIKKKKHVWEFFDLQYGSSLLLTSSALCFIYAQIHMYSRPVLAYHWQIMKNSCVHESDARASIIARSNIHC